MIRNFSKKNKPSKKYRKNAHHFGNEQIKSVGVMNLSWSSDCLVWMRVCVQSLSLGKIGVLKHVCNTHSGDLRAKESECPGLLHLQVKAYLRYRICSQ